MNEKQFGFNSTVSEINGKRYMIITRNGNTKRLIINNMMKRHLFVAEKATIC
jgi:hypothetical protein